jgi:hypothetical protein
LFIVHLEADAEDARALARELRASTVVNGLALQLQSVAKHQDTVVGRVWYLAGDPGADNAASIARFASSFISRLRGQPVRIDASPDAGGKQRQLYLGLPLRDTPPIAKK